MRQPAASSRGLPAGVNPRPGHASGILRGMMRGGAQAVLQP
jgi:hypothetical protein